MTAAISPFQISVDDSELIDLHDRLARTRWPEREPVDDWSQGIPLAYLQEICEYWRTTYDWRTREKRLNEFPQYRTQLSGGGTKRWGSTSSTSGHRSRTPSRSSSPMVGRARRSSS